MSKADAVRHLLEDNDVPSWMAPYDIPPGSVYTQVINDALENCECVVLQLSNASQESQFVKREIERAITYKKTIIPIQIEDVILNSGFKFFIGGKQIVALPNIQEDGAFGKV